jgi:hypothetical protein
MTSEVKRQKALTGASELVLSSLRHLCVLCASAVNLLNPLFTDHAEEDLN